MPVNPTIYFKKWETRLVFRFWDLYIFGVRISMQASKVVVGNHLSWSQKKITKFKIMAIVSS